MDVLKGLGVEPFVFEIVDDEADVWRDAGTVVSDGSAAVGDDTYKLGWVGDRSMPVICGGLVCLVPSVCRRE